jgi:hypothetical protein
VIPSIPFSDTGTTVGFINDYDQPCPSTSTDAPDVVYSYSPTEDTVVSIELCNGSDYNTKLYVYENTCDGDALVACNVAECGFFYGPSAIYELSLFGGNTYYIVIDGSTGGGIENLRPSVRSVGGDQPGWRARSGVHGEQRLDRRYGWRV